MNNSKLIRYISAYIKNWMNERGLTQVQASERLSINRGQLNGILNLNRGLSVEKLEAISHATGKDGLEALIEGRELLTGTKNHKENDNSLTSEQKKAIDALKILMLQGKEIVDAMDRIDSNAMTDRQAQAMEAFKICILNGGEGAEILADQALRLAEKKQAESEDPSKKQGYKSAS